MTDTAFNIIWNSAIRDRVPTAVFLLKMSTESFIERMISSESHVPLDRLRDGNIANDEWSRIATAASALTDAPVHVARIESPTVPALELSAMARQWKADTSIFKSHHEKGMVFVDCAPERLDHTFAALANELGVQIIALDPSRDRS